MTDAIAWFELPVADMDRATRFYSDIFDLEIKADPASPGYQMAVFPVRGGVGGALMQGEGYTPSRQGALVCLNGGDDLGAVLKRVEAAGGKVLREKFGIGENGFVAYFEDSEGNRVGLHSRG